MTRGAGLRRSPRRLTCGERLDVASVAPVLFAPFFGGVSEAPGTIAAKSLLLTPFPASTCERKSGVLARRLDRWANLCIVELASAVRAYSVERFDRPVMRMGHAGAGSAVAGTGAGPTRCKET